MRGSGVHTFLLTRVAFYIHLGTQFAGMIACNALSF
jgi:hypothetical protein